MSWQIERPRGATRNNEAMNAAAARPALHITTDASALDLGLIHRFLSEQSTWARGIPLATVRKAIDHSLCFGGFVDGGQVAFARVISDFATFANLVDVFVLPEYRGRGYSRQLMQAVLAHPELQGLRRFMLTTTTAAGLYAQFGFKPPVNPAAVMERYFPQIYSGGAA